MTREEAEGTTDTAACRFWIVSFTVTRKPFYALINIRFSKIKRLVFYYIPNRQLLSQYLLQLSSVRDRGDRFSVQVQTKHLLLHQSL